MRKKVARPSVLRSIGQTIGSVTKHHQVNAIDRNLRYAFARLLGKNKLGKQQQVYDDLLKRYNTKTSVFWERHRKKFKKEMVARGIDDFKKNTYIMEHYSTLKEQNAFWSYRMAYRTAIWQYFHYVKSKDRFNILHEQDWDKIQATDHFYNIIDFAKLKLSDKVTICEVGGGYGELGKVILSSMPNATYVLVDLPESLLLAQYYLGAKRTRFLLPNEIEQLERADVVVNIYSFAEMTPEIVKEYYRQFDRLKAKWFYSRNRDVETNVIDKVQVDVFKLLPKQWTVIKKEQSRVWPDFFDMYVKLR